MTENDHETERLRDSDIDVPCQKDRRSTVFVVYQLDSIPLREATFPSCREFPAWRIYFGDILVHYVLGFSSSQGQMEWERSKPAVKEGASSSSCPNCGSAEFDGSVRGLHTL